MMGFCMRRVAARTLIGGAALASIGSLIVSTGSCAQILGIHGPIVDEGGATDAPGDVVTETSGDVTTSPDAPGDVGMESGDAGTVYNDITDTSRWSVFDTNDLQTMGNGFRGAAFAAPYVYLVPYNNLVTSYNTRLPFKSPSSWATFDTHSLATVGDASVSGFWGAANDGRYIYFAPDPDDPSACPALRLDTSAAFTSQSAWATFDILGLNGAPCECAGAVFDGRYVDFIPYTSRIVTRYDTTANAFSDVSAWSTFDTSALPDAGAVYIGGGFDGQHVYAAPWLGHNVLRVDPAGFSSSSGWSTFDTTSVDAQYFSTAAHVDHFVYFVPHGVPSLVTRFDTTLDFDAGSAWSVFDTTTLGPGALGFYGSAFDGRFIYFVPDCEGGGGAPCSMLPDIVVRYDTQGPFTAPSSWSTFDVTTIDTRLRGFHGAVFDGEFVYFVPGPDGNGVVARFDAKSPPSMPAGYNGSFF